MAEMTVKELLALIVEYNDLYDQCQKRIVHNAMYHSGIFTVDPEQDAIVNEMATIEERIEALGFGIDRSRQVTCLFLAGEPPSFLQPREDDEPDDD